MKKIKRFISGLQHSDDVKGQPLLELNAIKGAYQNLAINGQASTDLANVAKLFESNNFNVQQHASQWQIRL